MTEITLAQDRAALSATIKPQDTLALDRSLTKRRTDEDGHLHVSDVPISKANICGYLGREIPGADALGLKPDQIYQLLRDPAELGKSADTFNGKPLLSLHKPQSANDHDHELTVGSVHDVYWDAPYLRAREMAIWDGASIAGIETGDQKQLSSSYRYEADMTPGELNGVRYDGVMRNIRGNHVALVETGRAGSDVVVSDSALPSTSRRAPPMAKAPRSRKALMASAALGSYLRPKLAADAQIDVTALVKGVTAKNWKTSKPKIKAALDAAAQGKLAADADLEDVIEMLDQLDDVVDEMPDEASVVAPVPSGEDDEPDVLAMLKGKIPDDLLAQVEKALSGSPDPVPAPAEDDKVSKTAMDAAIAAAVLATRKETEQSTVRRLNAIREAEVAVRPYVGEVGVAMDSAEAVFKFALDALKVDVADVPDVAYRHILLAQPKPGDVKPAASPSRVAMDAAAADSYAKRFPNAGRLGKH